MRQAENIKVVFPDLLNGPSNSILAETVPNEKDPENFFELPSFIEISNTLDNRSPKRDGNPPL